ncbi:hypothetical protein [Pararobbsia silviterrae]|uniref:H-type lectin domain-containing protein n=1 Tax=Pararobbsia silviterrae TaxID=1792498 RepID=A0A494XZM8_9BURK|nr:hypothetical protein [Pararobbsia silviterrae]RKP53646.1 hypothetical protein D7S86_15350 [Pararobbsia silviterrae]
MQIARRNGVVSVDVSGIRTIGESATQRVDFESGGGAGFSTIPLVSAIALGDVPYAINLSGVGLEGFTLTLTALQPPQSGIPSVEVDWLALPGS